MTERQNMLQGNLYDPSDQELAQLRKTAREAAYHYNQTTEDEQTVRQEILNNILGGKGANLYLEPNVRFDYGINIYIGDNCYFNFDCIFTDCAEIHIGNNVFVGPRASFLTPCHPLLAEERNIRVDKTGRTYNLEYCKPINIEDNVWLGGNVTVNGGVTIGHDSVIGSGSVVTRDIPPGVLAAGVPCRVIRPITEADKMEG